MKRDNESVRQEISRLYKDGVPVRELSAEFHLSKSTIYNWIRDQAEIKRTGKRIITAQEVYNLEREIKRLSIENEILRKLDCSFSSPQKEKLLVVDRLKEEYSVHTLCRTLDVLKSTYYQYAASKKRGTVHQRVDEELKPLIKGIFEQSKERFGAQKIKYVLEKRGRQVSRKHIRRLMQEMNLVCKQEQLRFFSTTNRKYKVYRNRIQQNFLADTPNLKWVSDVTHVYVKENLYAICIIMDLYSRKVISFKISPDNNMQLIQSAFDDAFESRGYPQNLIFHSDQGTQYTAFDFRKHLRELNVTQSFSNPGTPLDNAVAESFFSTMKREELSHNLYNTPEDLSRDVAEYIDFFNNDRPHQKLGMLTPSEAENNFYAEKK